MISYLHAILGLWVVAAAAILASIIYSRKAHAAMEAIYQRIEEVCRYDEPRDASARLDEILSYYDPTDVPDHYETWCVELEFALLLHGVATGTGLSDFDKVIDLNLGGDEDA